MATKLLNKIYYDPKHPASFGSPQTLYKHAKKLGYRGTLAHVETYLKQQDAYTLHRKLRLNFPRRRTISRSIDHQWQGDLVVLDRLSKYNRGFRYILTLIDVLSRFAFALPLKRKQGVLVVAAFKKIFKASKRKPKKLQTDEGTEFYNAQVKKYLKEQNIIHFSSMSDQKCAIVERFNRTLMEKMFKYFTAKNTLSYVHVLPRLIESYNARRHRSLGMSPKNVTKKNQRAVWNKLYKGAVNMKNKPFKFPIGQTVRLSKYRKTFRKGYLPKWTQEYFVVADQINSKPHTYRLMDLKHEIIRGIFYESELQSINVSQEQSYAIEILKTRVKRGKKQYYIHYKNWPKSHDEWISESQVV